MRLSLILVLVAAGLCAQGAVAQERFNLHVKIRDASFPEPRFDEPVVYYYVTRGDRLQEGSYDLVRTPKATRERDGFVYGDDWRDHLGDVDNANKYAHVWIDSGDFIPTRPDLLRAQLKSEYLGGEPIARTIALERKSRIAEIYRAEVDQILRLSRLGSEDFARAYKAAMGAVDLAPELDNYLLFNKVLRANLDTAETRLPYTPSSAEDLAIALPGFGDLSFRERWLVQLNLLDILEGAEAGGRSYGSSGTVRDAAIQLGHDMLDSLDGADADLESLPVVRVYQHVSTLHAEAEDCVSLARNAAAALDHAPAIDMGWTAQRRLFLEWGDCLERLTGFGTGPAQEELLRTARASTFLTELWSAYARAGDRAADRLRFATGSADLRIRALHEISKSVIEETE